MHLLLFSAVFHVHDFGHYPYGVAMLYLSRAPTHLMRPRLPHTPHMPHACPMQRNKNKHQRLFEPGEGSLKHGQHVTYCLHGQHLLEGTVHLDPKVTFCWLINFL